jgi:hypothetical protein
MTETPAKGVEQWSFDFIGSSGSISKQRFNLWLARGWNNELCLS